MSLYSGTQSLYGAQLALCLRACRASAMVPSVLTRPPAKLIAATPLWSEGRSSLTLGNCPHRQPPSPCFLQQRRDSILFHPGAFCEEEDNFSDRIHYLIILFPVYAISNHAVCNYSHSSELLSMFQVQNPHFQVSPPGSLLMDIWGGYPST